jgi:glycosyltransferase involved in cell wall biosynthesis
MKKAGVERMAKVLLIAPQPFFQWRGSPIRVSFNLLALSQSGYQVDLLTLPVGEKKDIPHVRIIRTPNLFNARKLSIGPSFLKALFDLVLFFHALYLAVKHRYDVIHGIEEAGAIAVVAAAITSTAVVFEKHSDPFSYKKEKASIRNFILRVYAMVERFSVRHADAVIGTGKGLVNQVLEMGSSTPVHHIFDIASSMVESSAAHASVIRAMLCKKEEKVLITYVGSFAVYQGIDLLFESIPIVIENNSQARFVIIGGNKDEIRRWKRWLSERKCLEQVEFTGKISPDDLPNYLSASDILLSPRLTGVNTPLKVLDYLKAGRAIVATDVASNRLILNRRTAVMANPTPEDYAKGILRLIDNEKLRMELGYNAEKLIREQLNFAEFKNRLAVCYQQILRHGN